MMLSLNEFMQKNKLENEAMSNIKIQPVCKDVDIFLRVCPFISDNGIVNLLSTKKSHWVAYINQNYIDSYAMCPPEKLSKFIIKRKGPCLFSQTKFKVHILFVQLIVFRKPS